MPLLCALCETLTNSAARIFRSRRCHRIYGHVSCAVPVTSAPVPPITTGAPAPLLASAAIVTVPVNPASHCATPSASTLAPTPAVQPLLSCTHHVATVTCAGVGGAVKLPVAVNCTWPLGKFCASAAAGARVMDWSSRGLLLLPQLKAPRLPKNSKTESRRNPNLGINSPQPSRTQTQLVSCLPSCQFSARKRAYERAPLPVQLPIHPKAGPVIGIGHSHGGHGTG